MKLLLLVFLVSSCSTLKKQKLLGSVIGAIVLGQAGQSIGKNLSPDAESEDLNKTLGLLTGSATGYFLGDYLAKDFWDNKSPPLLLLDKPPEQKPRVKVLNPKKVKKIELKENIPPFLQNKVKKASIFTYEIEAYEEETEDGRKIYHEPHKAYEYN